MLRMLREPGTGRPGPLVKLVAALTVLCMLALSAPLLVTLARWVVDLL